MENPAPDNIARPDLSVIEYKMEPEEPGNTATGERYEEILVDRYSITREALECEENQKRGDKKNQGDTKTQQREEIDRAVKV